MNARIETQGKKWVTNLKIIAGPCSAETESQVMAIAKDLSQNQQVTHFRAGIWKPRTRPGLFEGVGTIGLRWLRQVQQEYGLKCTTEVANAKHVEEACKHGLETLWVGARTTANPFAVAEIAEAMKGTNLQVMVKNPVNPDIELWTGAVERILNAGVGKVSLIHRGFSTIQKKPYRNAPIWKIAIDMQKRFSDLELICDPSHIGGHTKFLYEIALQAAGLGYQGLMIETHNDPQHAWSDAQQQITPGNLLELLNELAQGVEKHTNDPLANLREMVDAVDDHLIYLLSERMRIVEDIGIIKESNGEAVYQKSRWEAMLAKLIDAGADKGLSSMLIRRVFTAIHSSSVEKQTLIKTKTLI